jgi:aminoglycoside 6-adenylyltransferase
MKEENKEIIKNLKNWGLENKDIVCMLIGGSQGNKNDITDEYSDVDVVIFARHRRHYDKDLSWIGKFGKLASYHQHRIGVPLIAFVHKIYYANGTHLDLLFWNRRVISLGYFYLWLREKTILLRFLPRLWRKIIKVHFTFFPKYIYHGYYVLVDKKNYGPRMEYIGRKYKYIPSPFSHEKLQAAVSRFWAYAYSAAISISRNELLCAKLVGDHVIKHKLLELIEMYAKLKHGEDFDVFDEGRYFEKWAPPFIVKRMKNIYGYYEAEDAWRATLETMDLFSLVYEALTTEHPEIKLDNPEQHFRKLIEEIRMKKAAVMDPVEQMQQPGIR